MTTSARGFSPSENRSKRRLCQRQFDHEAEADHDQQRHDERLDPAKAARLQAEDEQHLDSRQSDAEDEIEAEQELERDRRSDQLGKVTGNDGQLAKKPENETGGRTVTAAAGLREVESGCDTQPRRQALQEHRHHMASTTTQSSR